MSYMIELTEHQRERLEVVRTECADDLPAPSDEAVIDALLDTWDAVDDGLYDDGPITVLEDGVAWVGDGPEDQTKMHGPIEIHDGWIRVRNGLTAWYPRERVREVHEQ